MRRGRGFGLLLAALLLVGAGAAGCGKDKPKGGQSAPSPSASATAAPTPSPTVQPGADLTGPLNILLAGVDTRVSRPGWIPRADSVLVLHVSKDLQHGYLASLPRDLLLEVPAFKKANFGGERTKLTHAMSYGSRVPGKPGKPSTAQGLELLSKTVATYIGIDHFDAAAVLTFGGLTDLVDAVGGIDLNVDVKVVSQHRRPDGSLRTLSRGGYRGPQMVYQKGQRHLTGWQALDFSRQRYLTGGDYTRARHQRQVVTALMRKLFGGDTVSDPAQLQRVLDAMGDALIVADGPSRVFAFAYALRNLRPEGMTLIGLPGRSVGSGGAYRGEALDPVAKTYFAALRSDGLAAFVTSNPKLVHAG